MDDKWDDDLMPDSGDYGISIWEAARDVAVFIAKVLGALLLAAFAVACVVYMFWREFAILNLLTSV